MAITIHVLAAGELFQHVLNAIAAFMNQDSFLGLLRITALIGIVMAAVSFVKTRDPMAFGRWFLGYVLVANLVLLPKTTVAIDDLSTQTQKVVANVPVVFALTASLVTTIGYGMAQSYDALLSIPIGDRKSTLPSELLYTQTGSLFGARLIQAATSFHLVDPVLKEEMNEYFRVCVVGDIRINHKYTVGDLAHSKDIWGLISPSASPLRMLSVNGKLVTCQEASKAKGEYSLRTKLDAEIKNAYRFFGVKLFGKPEKTTYEALFTTHLKSAFEYYQGLTDEASNIFLQSMMINAMQDGVGHYQAFTDATAGIVNQQFSKSQAQHRWAWETGEVKALWFLPLLHTWLTLLLFGVFPLVIALATIPSCSRILFYFIQFFFSLQLWPVLFAILNAGMTYYGSQSSGVYGQFSMVNIDKIDELHHDISGAAGYIMMLIPFFAYGFVSNLGSAFSNLATSMTGHVQGSTMAVAGEAASGSFGLGQTSFYNTTANNLSANKHDSNWTNLHGMHTEQMDSGVLKTTTGNGSPVFDVSPGMTKGAIHITDSDAMSASLNQAYEKTQQAVFNESSNFQSSLSNFAHRALQLSEVAGHDLRLGDGVSTNESAQYSKALSTMSHIAKDVAHRTGMSKEEALTHLTSGGWGMQAGIKSQGSLWGKLAELGTGFHAGADAHLKFDRSSSSSDRFHTGTDSAVSAREASDFNQALNTVTNFAKSHHFDDSHSEAAHLSNQMGADLRNSETASHHYEASLSKAQRIQHAKNFVESQSSQITADLNQAFPGFVANQIGESARDKLWGNPGDLQSLNQLKGLGQEFLASKRDELISQFGGEDNQGQVDSFYQQQKNQLEAKGSHVGDAYQKNSEEITQHANSLGVGIDSQQVQELQEGVHSNIDLANEGLNQGGASLGHERTIQMDKKGRKLEEGQLRAQKNVILPEGVHLPGEILELHKKEKKVTNQQLKHIFFHREKGSA